MKTIEIIKAKLSERTTEQLIQDAKVARANKQDETNRMICACAMDLVATRVSEEEFEKLYTEIYGE